MNAGLALSSDGDQHYRTPIAMRRSADWFVSELCHILPETPGKHGDLQGHADASWDIAKASPQR